MKLRFLCIIPARGGSKGLKNKNILKINGKRLIEYTLELANKLSSINKSILSSDEDKILKIGKKFKNIEIHKRPKRLASDKSLIIDTIRFLVDNQKQMGNYYEYVIILPPTSPLRKMKHLKDCLKLVKKNKPDSLVSVNKLPKPLEWLLKKNNKGFLVEAMGKGLSFGNRENKIEYFFPNGSIYILSTKKLNNNSYYFKKTISYEMSDIDSLDLDSKNDLKLANLIISK